MGSCVSLFSFVMRLTLTALLTLWILLPVAERVRVRTTLDLSARGEIAELEERYVSGLRQRDASSLERLVADDVRIVDADGALLDRTAWMVRAQSGAIRHAATELPDVRVYDRIALVHGRARVNGDEVYLLRVWASTNAAWRLVVEHTTDITEHATSAPPAFATLDERIRAGKIDEVPGESAQEDDVKRALRESHQLYWAKNVSDYVRTIGSDLIRAAETGVRPGRELVDFMRDSPHLPRTAPHQLEMWARVFGSVAIGGWLDSGTARSGAPSLNRFTLALVWRDGRWQIVQIQSNGVSRQSVVGSR
jgi:hypothetical protein